MKLGDLLPVFAATDAASATAERNGRFSEFPDEEPTVKQMSDWLDVNLPVITKTHGEMMRGALPPALIQLKAEADTDLSDYQPVAIDTTTSKTQPVRDAAARKAAAGETLLSSIRNLKNGVAQDLIEALSPRAPLRLKAMLDAHKDAHVAQCYDGIAMFKELIALRSTTGRCAVSEFTTNNSLVKDHAPYMTNGFKDQTAMNNNSALRLFSCVSFILLLGRQP